MHTLNRNIFEINYTFEQEHLKVDYISFKFKNFTLDDISRLAQSLDEKFSFDLLSRTHNNEPFKYILNEPRNLDKALLQEYSFSPKSGSYWQVFKLDFQGKYASKFYQRIKDSVTIWEWFDIMTLTRFDLCYCAEIPFDEDLGKFMEACCQHVQRKGNNRRASYELNSRGYILRIGHRSSSSFSRVYQNDLGLKFELEIKKKLVQSFQMLFLCGDFKKFEDIVARYFYVHYGDILVFDFQYTDWLLYRYRKMFQKPENNNSCAATYFSHYFKNNSGSEKNRNNFNSLQEKQHFMKFLQFLAFLRHADWFKDLNYLESSKINGRTYHLVEFYLKDYLNFFGISDKSYYHFKKMVDFFKYLLSNTKPYLKKFSDQEFRSEQIFLTCDAFTNKNRRTKLKIRISILEDLYFYSYPYYLPKSFFTYRTKHEMEIRIRIFQSMTDIGIKKRFPIQSFVAQFSLSNQERSKFQNKIIDVFRLLQSNQVIENRFQLQNRDGSVIDLEELSSRQLTKAKYIFFYESSSFYELGLKELKETTKKRLALVNAQYLKFLMQSIEYSKYEEDNNY